MCFIFSFLDLLAYAIYRSFSGSRAEFVLHFCLSFLVFGFISTISKSRSVINYIISLFFLAIFVTCYIISAKTEETLGVPLQLSSMVQALLHQPTAIPLLIEFLKSNLCMLICGLAALMVAAITLWFLTIRTRSISQLNVVRTFLVCAVVLGFSMEQSLRYLDREVRLQFFFSWPKYVNLGGQDPYREKAAAEDELARRSYNAKRKSSPTIAVIFSDCLRADHFSPYGYKRNTSPFLTGLFEQGKLQKIDWAFSACSESFCSIASVLGSKPFYKVSSKTLKVNELLARSGYETWAFLVGDHDNYAALGTFYANSFDHFYDYRRFPGVNMSDDEIVDRGIKELPSRGNRPAFIYIFLFSSHVLGTRLPNTDIFKPASVFDIMPYWNSRDMNGLIKTLGRDLDSAKQEITNFYDNGIVSSDRHFKGIFEALEAKGYLDDALIFLLGDHGEALGEHNQLGHSYGLYNEDIHIPLFIYDTSGMALANHSYATQEDIAPTILERVGLPKPDVFYGHSLYSDSRTGSIHQTRRGNNICFASIRAVSGKLYKYILCREAKVKSEEIYELVSDPKELHNIKDLIDSKVLAELRDDMEVFNSDLINTCSEVDCVEGQSKPVGVD